MPTAKNFPTFSHLHFDQIIELAIEIIFILHKISMNIPYQFVVMDNKIPLIQNQFYCAYMFKFFWANQNQSGEN